MSDPNKTCQDSEDSTLRQEMDVRAEPLSPAEKKLIGYSLGIGAALLIILIILTGAYKF